MPVKSFMATYSYSDWDTGQGTVWSETIKSDNLESANAIAKRQATEMGYGYELMDVVLPVPDNMNRLQGMYDSYLQACRRGRAGIRMFARKRRRGCRNYRPIRVQI